MGTLKCTSGQSREICKYLITKDLTLVTCRTNWCPDCLHARSTSPELAGRDTPPGLTEGRRDRRNESRKITRCRGASSGRCSLGLVVHADHDDDDRRSSLDMQARACPSSARLYRPHRVDARRSAWASHRSAARESRPPALVRQRALAASRQHLRRLPFADERLWRHAIDCHWRRQQPARRTEPHGPAQSAPVAAHY